MGMGYEYTVHNIEKCIANNKRKVDEVSIERRQSFNLDMALSIRFLDLTGKCDSKKVLSRA